MRGLATLVAVGGFLFFEATAFWAHDQQKRVERWQQVPAKIVGVDHGLVRFEYQFGKDIYTVEARRPGYHVGQPAIAFVDPTLPARALLDPRRSRSLTWMFAIGGLAWALVWALAARGVDLRRKLA